MTDPFIIAKRKMRELKDLINPTVQKTFEDNELVVIDYNVNKQLYDKGEDSKSSVIRPAYTPFTIRMKIKKNQPTDRVTLKDSGYLHSQIKVIARGDEVEITTSVPYAEKLFKKYGDDILGIQKELLEEFTNRYIVPNLKKALDDKIAEP